MITLFITASKYIQLLLIVLYTYCNFRYLSIPDQEDADPLCDWQFRIILLVHFLMNCIIYLKTEEMSTVWFYLLQLAFFLLYTFGAQRIYRNINRLLLNNTVFFLTYGLIILERLDPTKAMKQFVIIVGSAALTLVIPYLIDKIWDLVRWRFVFAVFGLLLQGIVLVIGATSYGAKMSISIGGFTFQASEIVKITFVLAMAGMLSRATEFRDIVKTSVVAALHVLVLVACKDLGSALIFCIAYLVMLFIATNRAFYLMLGTAAMGGASVFSYYAFSHVRKRVFAWLNPWSDMADRGYQITQSLFAIGTGGFAGLGLYQGMPKRIPIVEKDFIISAISEEMGAVTAICIILVCLGCFMQMMVIATYMEDNFYKLVSVGLAIEYIVQSFLTIGGAIKFIPSTGVTLPFVSYGGSSLVSAFIVFAIIQALYIIQGNEDEADEMEELEDVEEEPDDTAYDARENVDDEEMREDTPASYRYRRAEQGTNRRAERSPASHVEEDDEDYASESVSAEDLDL